MDVLGFVQKIRFGARGVWIDGTNACTRRGCIADLAANGPSADALTRARETAIGAAERARNANGYWANILTRDLDDPRQQTSIRTYVSGRREVDAAAVQAVVKRYFAGVKPLRIEVLPRAAKLPVIDVPPTPPKPAPQ